MRVIEGKELEEKIAKGNRFYQDFVEGTKYIQPQKHREWLKFVSKSYDGLLQGKEIKDIIKLLKELKTGTPLDEVKSHLEKTYDEGTIFNYALNALVRFAYKGPELYELVYPEQSSEMKKYLEERKKINRMNQEELGQQFIG